METKHLGIELQNELYGHLSKKERQMKEILDQLYGIGTYTAEDDEYHSFLRSPKGHTMQLDRYYPELSLAFEFRGPQHEMYTPFMHKTRADFAYLKACDALKELQCFEHRVALVVLKDEDDLSLDLIRRRTEEAIKGYQEDVSFVDSKQVDDTE